MTEHQTAYTTQFFLTPTGPCPYLAGGKERKVFTRLSGPAARTMNDALTQSGFRRSQAVAYRPACEGCNACVSVRILAGGYAPTRNHRRLFRRNADLVRTERKPEATREQFALMRVYLDARHPDGGMSDMSLFDYAAMVEETPVDTVVVEYRRPGENGDMGELVACALTDVMKNGLSMVYSFFHPGLNGRSLGTYMILDHVREARARGLSHVYLGYWVKDCAKMRYKSRFRPMEALGHDGWVRIDALSADGV